MRRLILLFVAGLILGPVLPLRAGDAAPPDASASALPADAAPAASNLKTSYEFDADLSAVGDATTNFGRGIMGDVSEQATSERLLIEPQYGDTPIYRFGLGYQRYNFGLSKAAPLPDILQAENIVVGLDFSAFNSWLFRVEADPGIYNDGRDTGFRDFNIPFTIGGSYIASDTIQWIAGLSIDIDRQLPIIPAVGVHWSVTDSWVIDAVLPTPRIEYDYNKNLTFYVGGDFDDGTYRVDKGLGNSFDNANPTVSTTSSGVMAKTSVTKTVPNTLAAHLGGSVVEYDEIRVGAGMSWKASKDLTFELECGYLPYREFDFHRANLHFTNDSGAPYGRLSLNAQF